MELRLTFSPTTWRQKHGRWHLPKEESEEGINGGRRESEKKVVGGCASASSLSVQKRASLPLYSGTILPSTDRWVCAVACGGGDWCEPSGVDRTFTLDSVSG